MNESLTGPADTFVRESENTQAPARVTWDADGRWRDRNQRRDESGRTETTVVERVVVLTALLVYGSELFS
jgi:hypothetical protein